MKKMIIGMLVLAGTILAQTPIPSASVSIILYSAGFTTSFVIKKDTLIPSDSQIFQGEEEILTSITTTNHNFELCSVAFSSFSINNDEKHYNSDNICSSSSQIITTSFEPNLDLDPAIELRGSATSDVTGFSIKEDSGNVKSWGLIGTGIQLTDWEVLGGPVIGFKLVPGYGWYHKINLIFIVGDTCRPKYFGARKLSLQLGEKRQVNFYWQFSVADYFSLCLSKGLFYIQNSAKLSWVRVIAKQTSAEIYPISRNIYSWVTYISTSYKHLTKLLEFQIIQLYSLPPAFYTESLITSNFTELSDTWLPLDSLFTFSDNKHDFQDSYGNIMFAEFKQGAEKTGNFEADGSNQAYSLHIRHEKIHKYTSYQIQDQVIVTQMKRFFKNIEISYRSCGRWTGCKTLGYTGNVFSGVKFNDREGHIVRSQQESFESEYIDYVKIFQTASKQTSEICGIQTNNSSDWVFVGGPIKGSYAIINGLDAYYDYISDFGVRVEDPCQANDDGLNISLNPKYTTTKDLRYHAGTDSQFWLTTVCQDSKALQLVGPSAFPFLKLSHGILAILSTPPDQCTQLEMKHRAPDNSLIINVFHLHTNSKFEATVENCSPSNGNCQPNIEDLALKTTAGLRKTVPLFQQDSVDSYFLACEGAFFDLTGAPFWLSISNSSLLVIDAPNDINIPGKYQFWIAIWEVILEVDAPCSSNYLQGLKVQGYVSVYIDKMVAIVVDFDFDDNQLSWEKVCGSIQRVFIRDAPIFVKYNENIQKIEIKPQDKVDQGLHIVLVELVIKSIKSFNVLKILVKFPIKYISENLKPFFWPNLKDKIKQYGERWFEPLSSIHDPAEKYVYGSKSKILPEQASDFVKMRFSSNTLTNSTQIFFIDANDTREKTGNVSLFIELSAFNQNYSVFELMNKNTRRQMWRWRRATYGFNLTIVHPEKELIESVSDNLCKKRFIANYKKEIIIGNEKMNICNPNFSQNITMSKTALVSLRLGDFIIVRTNFNIKSGRLQAIYEFRIGEQQLTWKPVEYVTKNEVQYKQNQVTSSKAFKSQITTKLSAQLFIEHPWDMQKSENLRIKICEPKIVQILQKNCLQLSYKIPVQMYRIEKILITVIFRVLLLVNLILMILNSALLIKQDWNLPPSYFSNLLLLCHMLATGIKLPGAVIDFNQRVVAAVTLKLRQLLLNSDQLTSQLDAHKAGLVNAGYNFISSSSNLGITLLTLFYLTKLSFISSNIILFFIKTKTRCGKLNLGRHGISIATNISTGSYFNFEMSSLIVQITSAFVFLRFSENYKSQSKISATTLWQKDFFVAIIQLGAPVYLCLHLMIIAITKQWYGLRQQLIKQRSWYALRHQQLMKYPHLNSIREDLTNLEKQSIKEEDRFSELRKTIGSVQSEGLYPSVTGFERSILYFLLKLIMPVLFAAILVFVDTVWIAVCSLLILLGGYFVLQFWFVKANISRREKLNVGLYILVGYISVFLFIQENSTENNYFGWIYIVIMTVHIIFTSVDQLQKAMKRMKQIIIGVKQPDNKVKVYYEKAPNLSPNVKELDIVWSKNLFSSLAQGIWKRPDLFKEMQYWVYERIENLPEVYDKKQAKREQMKLQATSDIFFCKIFAYSEENYAIRPRQQENLMLTDCRRTLKIWKKDSKYGVLLNDGPPLMSCPYPKQNEISEIREYPGSQREQKAQSIDISELGLKRVEMPDRKTQRIQKALNRLLK